MRSLYVCVCVFPDERGFEVFVFSQMSVKGYSVVMDVGARRGWGGGSERVRHICVIDGR